MIDNVGTLMSALANLSDLRAGTDRFFFDEIEENALQRHMWGTRREDEWYSKFHASPTTLFLELESAAGIGIGEFERVERVQKMLRLMHSVLGDFDVTHLSRGGARFTWLDTVSAPDPVANFGRLFDERLISLLQQRTARIGDLGVAIDGQQDDRTKYHLRFGPYKATEAPKWFQQLSPEALAGHHESANLIVDLDLYEENFVLRASPAKWLAPFLQSLDVNVRNIAGLLDTEVKHDNVANG